MKKRSVSFFELLLALCCIDLSRASMRWALIEDTEAVCNDYSRAGFFIEKTNPNTTKWIIFLESGGLCFSPETCNQRFFKPEVRNEFATNKDEEFYEFDPEFDLTRTWNTLKSENRSLSNRINPYMTSISTYIRDDERFATVEGRDILDESKMLNPVFYEFNRVVVPYCSSDMWLAEDDYADGVDLESENPQQQFLDDVYLPDSRELQFTFRGKTILRGVISQLINSYNLSKATEVLLAGSSAGGLGVVNNAKWIGDLLGNTVEMSILVDSSWFINFRGNIFRRFNGTLGNRESNSSNIDRNDERLFDLISSIPQCEAEAPTGFPCCISLECVITNKEFFPVGEIPVIIVFSLYDVFLLADAIAQQTPPGEIDGNRLPSLGGQFVLTIAEYGGAMNSSIAETASPKENQLSYIATQCFQHVYLATSTLWGQQGILGDSSVEQIGASLGEFSASFRHVIQSAQWTKYYFSNHERDGDGDDSGDILYSSCNKSEVRTMQQAINMWYTCRYSEQFVFRDDCNSIHCHDFCPENVTFLQIDTEPYPVWSRILIVCIVVSITVVSILAKIIFYVWKLILFSKQDQYIEKVVNDEENFIDGIPKFPVCGLEDAVSIACLDLKYSVKFRRKKIKDERRDSTSVSFAIAHHIAEEEEEEDAFYRGSERRSTRSLRSMKSARIIATEGSRQSTSHLHVINEEDHDATSEQYQGLNGDSFGKHKDLRKDSSGSNLKRQDAYDKKDSNVPYTAVGNEWSEGDDKMEETDGYEEEEKSFCMPFKRQKKQILKGISIYFNPGELVGIMGPSGCGKTTFLDLLTGRRTSGNIEGDIFVNGIRLEKIRDTYMSFTGYVLQLATPYYEELTVRENVTLSAQIKLPRTMTWREKFERVEQVIDVTGLTNVADLKVGGLSGPGLSGGQKKRLTIALQLLTMPKVIFLDEPTSGLDATSSVELLSHLNILAETNRTVVLTIHQPRLEIFHMFHKLILLSDGQIAYHGVPQKAYGFFVEAAVSSFWNKKLIIPEIGEHNPADIIMDMLGKPIFRRAILSHYQESTEPELIKWAIRRARIKDFESISMATIDEYQSNNTLNRPLSANTTPYQIQQSDFVRQAKATWFNRLSVLETRADIRASLIWKLYLPIIFFGYGAVLGTVYFQQDQPLLIMAGFCVYSVASALFMFPVMQNYFLKALEVYNFENADGAGRPSDIIIQAFTRFTTMAIIPVILCSAILYLLLVKFEYWDIRILLQLIVVGMALNQTWIALLMALLCAFPNLAFRLSPIISSVAGFTSGFFIPIQEIGWYYRWLFYINPNFYGFSASASILLRDISDDCASGVELVQCYVSSGSYVLKQFNFDETRPFMNIAVLLLMTLLYILIAIFCNWIRHSSFYQKFKAKFGSKQDVPAMEEEEEEAISEEIEETEFVSGKETSQLSSEKEGFVHPSEKSSEELPHFRDMASPYEDDVFEPSGDEDTKKSEVRVRWKQAAHESLEKKYAAEDRFELDTMAATAAVDSQGRPKRLDFRQKQKRKRVQSIFLGNNQEHVVYNPSIKTPKTPGGSQFANLVNNLMVQSRTAENPVPSPSPSTAAGNSLKERREQFEWSIKATQEVVKEKTEELNKVDETCRDKITLRDVTKKLTERLKEERTPKMANIVGEVMQMASSAPTSFDDDNEKVETKQRTSSTTGITKPRRRQRHDSSSNNLILQKFRDIAKKQKQLPSHNPPKPPMKKISSVGDLDLSQKNRKRSMLKRSTDMDLPTSTSSDVTSPNTALPMSLSKVSSPPAPPVVVFGDLEDIKEDETEEIHSLIPDVKVTFSNKSSDSDCDKNEITTVEYQKITDSSSPLTDVSDIISD